MERISKIMDRLNKPFEPITTLFIIYLALVAVAIAIYALIQMYVEEKELAASLLGWTATLFATIALLYTYNNWRKQKASEVIANEAKEIFGLTEKLPTKMNLVLEDMLKMAIDKKVPNDFDKERFISFRAINMEIIKRLELIKFKNKNSETLKRITDFNSAYSDYAIFYHKSEPIILKELLDSKDKYQNCFENLRKDMYEYALFKKNI
jgi:hypothetical protein